MELIFEGGKPLFICCLPAIDAYIKLVQHDWKLGEANVLIGSRRVRPDGQIRGTSISWVRAHAIMEQDDDDMNDGRSSNTYEFDDGYNHPEEVPENNWYTNTQNPQEIPGVRAKFHKDANGDWCHVGQSKKFFGDRAAGGVSTNRMVLSYHPTEPKYILRKSKKCSFRE